MPNSIPVKRQLREVIARIKARPRYRAQMLRECFLEEAGKYGGCDLQDVGREFWAKYGIEPKANLLAQQATLLRRDGRITRPRHGWYKLAPPPAMPTSAPAAHAPAAPSIFD